MSEDGSTTENTRYQDEIRNGINLLGTMWNEGRGLVRDKSQTADEVKSGIGIHLFDMFGRLPRHTLQLEIHYIEKIKKQFGPEVDSDIPMSTLGIRPGNLKDIGIFDETKLRETEQAALQEEIKLFSGFRKPESIKQKKEFISKWITEYKKLYDDTSFDKVASRFSHD